MNPHSGETWGLLRRKRLSPNYYLLKTLAITFVSSSEERVALKISDQDTKFVCADFWGLKVFPS